MVTAVGHNNVPALTRHREASFFEGTNHVKMGELAVADGLWRMGERARLTGESKPVYSASF